MRRHHTLQPFGVFSVLRQSIASTSRSKAVCLFNHRRFLYSASSSDFDPAIHHVASSSSLNSSIMRIVRQRAVELHQLKKAHVARPSTEVTERAHDILRRLQLPPDVVPDPRVVVLLLGAASYFGLRSDHDLVKSCLRCAREQASSVSTDVLPLLVTSMVSIRDRESLESLEAVTQALRTKVRYMDAPAVVSTVSSLSKGTLRNHRLYGTLGRRVLTLSRLDVFTKEQLVVIVTAFAKARYQGEHLYVAIAYHFCSKLAVTTPKEVVPVLLALSQVSFRHRVTIRQLAGRCVRHADDMDLAQVCTVLVAFANLTVKTKQLVSVFATRAVEMVGNFMPHTIATVLRAFSRLTVSNPELFDALAERALMLAPHYPCTDLVHTVTSLCQFNLSDPELFDAFKKRLLSSDAQLWREIPPNLVGAMLKNLYRVRYVDAEMHTALFNRVQDVAQKMNPTAALSTLFVATSLQYPLSDSTKEVLSKTILEGIASLQDDVDAINMLRVLSETIKKMHEQQQQQQVPQEQQSLVPNTTPVEPLMSTP
eukprot:PhM_4_TR15492/c0_g1_i1/m.5023